jgi:hypothetical protein
MISHSPKINIAESRVTTLTLERGYTPESDKAVLAELIKKGFEISWDGRAKKGVFSKPLPSGVLLQILKGPEENSWQARVSDTPDPLPVEKHKDVVRQIIFYEVGSVLSWIEGSSINVVCTRGLVPSNAEGGVLLPPFLKSQGS